MRLSVWPSRRIRPSPTLQHTFEVNLAPLIDIIFLQMIFFMLTSSFIFQPGITVHLPKTVTSELAESENLIITISKANQLFLNNKVVTIQELRTALSSPVGLTRPPVLIQADRDASMGRVVEIWDTCRNLGIHQVHLATDAAAADKLHQTR